jgi:protein-S-isoprenylcysteine O-methyltransferase Ste14
VAWWARLLFAVALLFGLTGPLAALAGVPPLAVLDQGWLRAVGVTLAGGGVLATVGAQLDMGGSWRVGVDPDERTGLVTGGVFALARNRSSRR